VLNVGDHQLSVTAAATDNYNVATRTVRLTVNKADQTITWSNPAAITYGTALGNAQLSATVMGVAGGSAAGALTYSPAAGAVLGAGTQNLKVDAAETDNYNAATKTVSLTVNKANQTITWSNPAAITYGTALGNAQLSATVTGVAGGSAAGALTYSPAAGAVLDAGSRTLSVTAAATNNYELTTKTVSLTVNQQTVNPVADTYYTGSSFYWTTNSSSNTATLNLVTTLKTNSNYDGDIQTAKVSFGIRNGDGTVTPITGAQNLPVGLVNPGELTVGTAATNVQYTIKNDADIINIAVTVSGNYNNLTGTSTDKAVTIAKPVAGGLITGGGEMDNASSAGFVKGAAGNLSDYNFYVQYNKSLTNPQGGVNITVRSFNDRFGNPTLTLHTYNLKSNAISVLATTSQDAQFSGKANISEAMADGTVQSIEGNCTMQLDIYDGFDNKFVSPSTTDQLAVTVYRNGGGIWFSNNWNGTRTVRKNIVSGVLSVSGTGPATTAQAVSAKVSTAKSTDSSLLEIFPNPMVEQGTIHFRSQKGGKAQVYLYNQVGALVATLYNAEVEGGHEYYIPLSRENIADGVYFCRMITNGKVENKRITIMR